MQGKTGYLREEIKAGVIIVASFVILSGFVILIGGSRFFEKSDLYYTQVMNAAGLEKGAQVKLGGVRVGRISDVREPTGPGKPVTIEIALKEGTILYKGTKAVVTQIGFVGDIYLLLTVDHTTAGRIRAGEEIPSEERTDLGMMMTRLDELSQTVDVLIKDVDRLFNEKNAREIGQLLGNANKAVVSVSSNVEQVASSLRATTDKIDSVLNEVEEIVKTNKGEVSELIRSARKDLDKAGDTITHIEEAAKTIDAASGSAGKAIDEQSQNLDNLISALTKTTEDLRDVIQEIRRKPWSILYKEKKGE
ncbi:MAG: MlaD family protein [Thermodesulfovibrionales bacterium]|jgi:ABC-type transporter Mla subunit MlaD